MGQSGDKNKSQELVLEIKVCNVTHVIGLVISPGIAQINIRKVQRHQVEVERVTLLAKCW